VTLLQHGNSAWINRNVIGPPKATESTTVERLTAQGYVGIYSPKEEESDWEEEI